MYPGRAAALQAAGSIGAGILNQTPNSTNAPPLAAYPVSGRVNKFGELVQ